MILLPGMSADFDSSSLARAPATYALRFRRSTGQDNCRRPAKIIVADQLLTIVDIYSRECVALEVAPRFCSDDVVDILKRACRERGVPNALRCDNGTEFVAKPLDQWAFWNKVALDFSRPGKPTDNAFIESFNGGVRRELLNPSYFETIDQARKAARVWREEYNEFRPHSMLANKTPKEFAAEAANHTRSRSSNDPAGLRTG